MKRPVLILGGEPRISIPVARSLHAHGHDVDLAALSDAEARISSRSIRRSCCLSNSGDPHVALEQLIVRNGYDMLIPATDAALAFVSQREDSLRALLHVACPPRETVDLVLDKSKTLERASKAGIHVPRTVCVTHPAALEESARRLRFPIIAKPYHKCEETDFKVKSFRDVNALLGGFPNGVRGGVLLQEFAPGVGVGVEILMQGGEPLAVFQHRRVKEVPATGGAAAVAISERPNPFLLDQGITLLRELGWNGIAMVEFRYDRDKKQSSLMEVNGRYWGTIALAIRCGVDFPWHEWQLAHEVRPMIPATYSVGEGWRWTAGYLRRWHGMAPRTLVGSLKQPTRIAALLPSIRDFSPFSHDALWRLSDPMPAVAELSREMSKLLVSDFKAATRKRRGGNYPVTTGPIPMPVADKEESEIGA